MLHGVVRECESLDAVGDGCAWVMFEWCAQLLTDPVLAVLCVACGLVDAASERRVQLQILYRIVAVLSSDQRPRSKEAATSEEEAFIVTLLLATRAQVSGVHVVVCCYHVAGTRKLAQATRMQHVMGYSHVSIASL